MIKNLITVLAMLFCTVAQAQVPDSIKQELYRVNRTFDSSRYIAFDVGITYYSDTVLGRFEYEEMHGSYLINNRNMYYKMGDIEYIQNDSFIYNIYHDEKMMMMTKLQLEENTSQFPLREFVDSTLTLYATAYTISLTTSGETKIIAFNANPGFPDLPYRRFAIHYEPNSYFPEKFEMTLNESLNLLGDLPDSIAANVKFKSVQKRIAMTFSNYHNPTNLDVFEDKSYVYYNRLKKRYQPIERWEAYQFLPNGVDGDEYDPRTELYPPTNQ